MIGILDISYYGKPFCGFARQPEQLTVQGSIEDALKVVFQEEIQTTCAGRTDAGVHAKHQFVSFEIPNNKANDLADEAKLKQFASSLNNSIDKLTHDDIHIQNVKITKDDFSARFDAKLRKYSYFIKNSKTPSLFMKDFTWHIPRTLDIESMKKASQYLIGEHDFKSFCVSASAVNKTTMRNITHIEFKENSILDEEIIEIEVWGNAFLHSMVRTIVGTLVKVGVGQRNAEWVRQVLEAKRRSAAGECAPAKGLVLMNVEY